MHLRWMLSMVGTVCGLALGAAPAAAADYPGDTRVANPGTYHVYSCHLPNGTPTPTDGWLRYRDGTTAPGPVLSDECATGGGLTIRTGNRPKPTDPLSTAPYDAPQTTGAQLEWEFVPPDATSVERMSIWRTVNLGVLPTVPFGIWAARVTTQQKLIWTTSTDARPGATPEDPPTVIGDPTRPLSPENLIAFAGDARGFDPSRNLRQTPNVTVGLYCFGNPPDNPELPGPLERCDAGPKSASLTIWSADALLRDERRPVVSAVRTSTDLGPGAVVRRPIDLFVEATDAGAGLASTQLFVDGQPQTARPFDATPTCRSTAAADGSPIYPVATPCPTAGTGIATWDPASVQPGQHALRLEIADAAGNRTVAGAWAVTTVREVQAPQREIVGTPIDRGAPNGSIATDRATLTASLLDGGLRVSNLTWKAPWAKASAGTVLEGSLVAAGGSPIAGAELNLVTTSATYGAEPVPLGRTTTGRTGTFRTTIPVAPGSATVTVRWRARVSDTAPAAESVVSLRVTGDTTVKATPRALRRGGRVRLSGELRGRGGSVANVPVLIQGRGSRGSWATVAPGETDRRGRWKATKVLAFSRGTVRFRVRTQFALSYPYEPSAWRTVSVRVR